MKCHMTRSPKAANKIQRRIALYVLVDEGQHQALQVLALLQQSSLSDLVREALGDYLSRHAPSARDVERVIEQVRAAARAKT